MYPYGYFGYPIFTGYVDPWLFGNDWYGNDNGYGNDNAMEYDGEVPAPYRDYGTQPDAPQDYEDQPAMPQYRPSPQYYAPPAQPGAVSAAPAREQIVTVIFNDGRPPVKIHNYLLTPSTLTVLDPSYREIPLNQVNLPATEQANRAAGVEFGVPPSR